MSAYLVYISALFRCFFYTGNYIYTDHIYRYTHVYIYRSQKQQIQMNINIDTQKNFACFFLSNNKVRRIAIILLNPCFCLIYQLFLYSGSSE